jgi:hypothetical protein
MNSKLGFSQKAALACLLLTALSGYAVSAAADVGYNIDVVVPLPIPVNVEYGNTEPYYGVPRHDDRRRDDHRDHAYRPAPPDRRRPSIPSHSRGHGRPPRD